MGDFVVIARLSGRFLCAFQAGLPATLYPRAMHAILAASQVTDGLQAQIKNHIFEVCVSAALAPHESGGKDALDPLLGGQREQVHGEQEAVQEGQVSILVIL